MKTHVKCIKTDAKNTLDEERPKGLDHGWERENHGVVTLVSQIMPTYFLGSVFHKEGTSWQTKTVEEF